MCSCDGVFSFFLDVGLRFPDTPVDPKNLGSDMNKQFYAFCRTSQFAGRRTNLDAITLAYECEKRNVYSGLENIDGEEEDAGAYMPIREEGGFLLQLWK